MEYLPNGISLDIPAGCFPLSTDSMALAHFVRLPRNPRVLDLGSGCAVLGLLLCSRDPQCQVTGVEADRLSHEAAVSNIRRNRLEGRMESICADAGTVSRLFTPGSFSCCVSNPPYFSGGPRSLRTPDARNADSLPIPTLMEAVAWAVKFGGDVYVVHKPQMLGALIAQGGRFSLEAKELCLVRHRADADPAFVLLRLRKGAKPGLTLRQWTLYHPDGSPTELYREIYHMK